MVKLLMLVKSLGGGIGRVVSELSLNLDPNIHHEILTLTNEISYPSNVPPLSMNFILKDIGITNLIYSIFMGIIKYRKIAKSYKPDVSMSFLYLDNFINVLSNIGNNQTKVIVSVHGGISGARTERYSNFLSKSLVDKFLKFFIMVLYNKADLVVAVSKGVKNELIREFNIKPEKIKMIYNPVDTEKIKHLANDEVSDEWFDDEMPILINMGRLAEPKGQWHLIRVFSKVIEIELCKLAICGNGELKQYLENLVIDLGLQNDVKFLGWQDNPFKYISKSSIFVSSSIREGFHYALIEAMACGCPIISTDCKYGPPEILGNGKYGVLTLPLDGIFYKASDPLTLEEEYLANEIIMLLKNDKLRKWYSKKGKERTNDFDLELTIKKYENIFR